MALSVGLPAVAVWRRVELGSTHYQAATLLVENKKIENHSTPHALHCVLYSELTDFFVLSKTVFQVRVILSSVL